MDKMEDVVGNLPPSVSRISLSHHLTPASTRTSLPGGLNNSGSTQTSSQASHPVTARLEKGGSSFSRLASRSASVFRPAKLHEVRDARYALDSRAALKAFRLIGGFDGIQIDELREVISTVLDSHVREALQKNLNKLFDQFDANDDGLLDVIEFENMIQNSTMLQQAVYDLLAKAETEERNEYLNDGGFVAGEAENSSTIDIISVCITCTYIVTLALQLDCAPRWHGWIFVELGFLIAFSLEICIRCSMELHHNRRKRIPPATVVMRFLVLPMSIFDLTIITVGWIELGSTLASEESGSIVSAYTWVRLLRFGRCARLMRIFWYWNELRVVVTGILTGMKSAVWGLTLIFLLVFAWAVVIRTAVENEWTEDEDLNKHYPNTPASMLKVIRCMGLSADASCKYKPHDIGWAFDLLWCASEGFILIGILNVIASVYVVQANANAQKIKQSINFYSYRQDIVRLQQLDRLLRTLIHPGREQSNPKDRNAAEVARLIRTDHPDVAARLPNLEMQIVHFAQHIQDARKLHQSVMDTYEAQEVIECKALRNIPSAKTYMVHGTETLLVDDDASANNPLMLPMAPIGALHVMLLQGQEDLEDLLLEAQEVQTYIKSIIYPQSAWATRLGAGSSGNIWKLNRGLCDEAIDPGIKSIDRIEQKVKAKYGGRYERNRDYCRVSLIYDSALHLLQAIPRFLDFQLQLDNFQVVSLENRFLEPHPLGWRDITLLLKVRVPSTVHSPEPSHHIMEVQMRLRRMAEINHEGHRFYEDIRANLPEDLVTTILDRLVTDTTLDLGITKAEWLQCLPNKEVKKLLDELGIPRRSRKGLFDIIDIDGSGTVTSSELQEMLLLVKDPVHAHEMMGCHFRVRDIQRQLQTRIEPQLQQMSDFNMKCMEENECLLEDLFYKIKDVLWSPELSRLNIDLSTSTMAIANTNSSVTNTASIEIEKKESRESTRTNRRRNRILSQLSTQSEVVKLSRASSHQSGQEFNPSETGREGSVAGDVPLPPVLEGISFGGVASEARIQTELSRTPYDSEGSLVSRDSKHSPVISCRTPPPETYSPRSENAAVQSSTVGDLILQRGNNSELMVAYLPKELNGRPVLVADGRKKWRALKDFVPPQFGGLSYRTEKREETKLPGNCLTWGTTVEGVDEGDGWVRVQLPKVIYD